MFDPFESAGAPRPAGAGAWAIAPGVIHVWTASLERSADELAGLRRLLSDDERARADRFRFARDRDRYTNGRGLLRVLLGAYTERPPDQLSFTYSRFNKPRLAHGGPCFNLSHSGALALIAISADVELGVDVELDDEDFSRDRIAEMFFAPAEVQALHALAPEQVPRAFLSCWTRKEAFIKARGDGLALALDSFEVALAPDVAPAVLRTAWSPDEAQRWSLHDLTCPDRGYIAALAARVHGLSVVRRRVPERLSDLDAAWLSPGSEERSRAG